MSNNKYIDKNNLYKDFDINPFKKMTPPKKELEYHGKIKLNNLKDNNLIKNELKESIRRILIQETSSSIRFRRKLDVVERLLDSLLDSMYPCDYEDEKTFLDGVIYELGWLVRDDDYGLGEYWDEVWDYIGRVRADEIYEYYRERCKK